MNNADGQSLRDRLSRPDRALRAALWCRAAKAATPVYHNDRAMYVRFR